MIQVFMCKRGISHARIWGIPARDASEVVVYEDRLSEYPQRITQQHKTDHAAGA
jgi:hypothetical protein